MTDRHAGKRPRRGRLSGRFLWVLAAILGGATLMTGGAIIHDRGRRRAAAELVARATAEQVVSMASERLTVTALSHFGVLAHLPPGVLERRGAAVATLAQVQHQMAHSGRTDLLDASTFFRLDLPTKRFEAAQVLGNAGDSLPPTDVLKELATAAAAGPRGPRRFTIHVATDPRLHERAVLTAVDYDSSGAPRAVNGLVARAENVARLVFDRFIVDPPVVDTTLGLVKLDTLSLAVRTADGRLLFGSIGPELRHHATVRPIGPLEGLSVEVAITTAQIPRQLTAFAPMIDVWHLGLLIVCTTLVIAAAAGLSRRELLLARARSDFIAGVSHDLRMPLAQILLAGETLTMQRERDVAERQRLTTSIVREAKRLISLVENVLLFSRSGAVEFTPHLEPLSVHALFADVDDGIQLAVEDAGQHLEVDVDPSLAVLADRQLLRQALVNLVDNALKYGHGGARIRLGGETRGSAVRLVVEDEGPGIPTAERARMFEAYERLARDQTSERTGSGLGLAVVRHIARVCGGDAWLEDASPKGTRAVIELPAAALPAPTRETTGVA
jgi:signal transduction histidine kinase